jgi:hypothetical protein
MLEAYLPLKMTQFNTKQEKAQRRSVLEVRKNSVALAILSASHKPDT